MNFLHFAIVLFVVSPSLLVGVSLATSAPNPGAAARPDVRARWTRPTRGTPRARRLVRVHLASTVAMALTVIALWVHFA